MPAHRNTQRYKKQRKEQQRKRKVAHARRKLRNMRNPKHHYVTRDGDIKERRGRAKKRGGGGPRKGGGTPRKPSPTARPTARPIPQHLVQRYRKKRSCAGCIGRLFLKNIPYDDIEGNKIAELDLFEYNLAWRHVGKLSAALSKNTTLQRVELDWLSLTSTQISHLKSKHPTVLENSFVHTYGERPFPKACAEGRLEDVKKMVEIVMSYFDDNDLKVRKTWSGINESKSKEGKTGVYLAAFHGHADVVKYLLGKGANEQDIMELFITACAKGKLKDVQLMVECLPTLVESKSKEGKTGVYLAAFHGHADVVKYLLGKGANEQDIMELFITACAKGKLKDVQLMVECLPTLVESKSKEGKTGVYLAAFHGHADVVKYLLGKGANDQDVVEGTWARFLGEENVPIWNWGAARLIFKGITDYDCNFLAPDLSKMKALKFLAFRYAQIGEAGVAHLSKALPEMKGLNELCLQGSNIGDAGLEHLSKALPEMQALKGLVLHNSKIGDAGMEHLSNALPEMKGLQTLYLGFNKFGDAGLEHLSNALPEMQALEVLTLINNQIGDAGVAHLSKALPEMKGLVQLYLEGNNIGDVAKSKFKEEWKKAGRLGELRI